MLSVRNACQSACRHHGNPERLLRGCLRAEHVALVQERGLVIGAHGERIAGELHLAEVGDFIRALDDQVDLGPAVRRPLSALSDSINHQPRAFARPGELRR